MTLMSVRGYARHRSITHPAVLKAIATGRITRRPDGKIDCEQADRDWERNTDATKPRSSTFRPRPTVPDPLPPEMPADFHEAPEPPTPAVKPMAERVGASLAAAKAMRETYLARQARLTYEEAEGRLVDVEEVRAAAYRASRETQRRLLDLAHQLGPELAVIQNPLTISQVLEGAFTRVCEDMMRVLEDEAESPAGERGDRHAS